MKIGLIVNPSKRSVYDRVGELKDWLTDRGCEVLYDRDLGFEDTEHAKAADRQNIGKFADVVVVFGGDGTLLNISHLMAEYNTPILGVNSGGLGFLTETTLDEMYDSMDRILDGDYEVKKRMMLSAELENRENTRMIALNDMVLSRFRLGRVIQVAAYVNDSFVTSYVCDGMIVSTPTGSTAYNLSASGPILHPSLKTIVLNPICPHTLTNRPLILPGNCDIRLEVESSEACILTSDGQDKIEDITEDNVIKLWKASKEVTLIKPRDRDFYKILRTKLHWGGKTSEDNG